MKRIIRDRRLTSDEAAKYRAIREQVAADLPGLIARHHERAAALDRVDDVLAQLKAAREKKGLSLADLGERIGMEGPALSKLENGERADVTMATLVRYADAVGMQLELSLIDAS